MLINEKHLQIGCMACTHPQANYNTGTNFCFKKCVAVIAMQLEDCVALSAVCVAVSFCMLWGLKRERPATDHTIMKNANANIQYIAVLITT